MVDVPRATLQDVCSRLHHRTIHDALAEIGDTFNAGLSQEDVQPPVFEAGQEETSS